MYWYNVKHYLILFPFNGIGKDFIKSLLFKYRNVADHLYFIEICIYMLCVYCNFISKRKYTFWYWSLISNDALFIIIFI